MAFTYVWCVVYHCYAVFECPTREQVFQLHRVFLGQVGLEPTANRLKAEYSTTELLTHFYKSIVLGLCTEYKFLLMLPEACNGKLET